MNTREVQELALGRPTGATVEIIDVTPEIAEQWLQKNQLNRPLSAATVARYVGIIERGEWRLTHQGVAFDVNGLLVDGQHRLWAIVKSGRSVRMVVTHGLEPEAIGAIDIQKSRTAADSIEILSRAGRADVSMVGPIKQACETVNMIMTAVDRQISKPTPRQVLEALEKYRDGLAAIARFPQSASRGMWQAPIRGALVFAYKTNPEAVMAFAAQVVSGAQIDRGFPSMTLRDYVQRSGAARGSEYRRDLFARTLNACAYHVHKKKLGHLYATMDAVAFFGLAHGLDLPGSSKEGPGNYMRRLASGAGLQALAER